MGNYYRVPNSIEQNLTDEIFTFIKDNSIHLNLEEMNFFCLTNTAVMTYNSIINKFSLSDYESKINNLKRIADRIQYYSTEQIEIILPHYPIPVNQFIYLFTNTLMMHNHSKEFISKFLDFWDLKRNGRVEINFALEDTVYRPDIKTSHKHIIKNINLLNDDVTTDIKNKSITKIIKYIDDGFRKKKSYSDKSIYHKVKHHYKDINNIPSLKKQIKEMLTYDTSDVLDYLENEIDLFSIWIYLDAVNNYKFLTNSDLALTDGTNFRDKLKQLREDTDTMQNYSKKPVKINIPLYENVSIFLMLDHLGERGLLDSDIDILFSIFSHREKKPSRDKYITEKENILHEAQLLLSEIYEKNKHGNRLEKNAHHKNNTSWQNTITIHENLQLCYTAEPNSGKNISDKHQKYIEKILNIISVFDIEDDLKKDNAHKEEILKAYTLFTDKKIMDKETKEKHESVNYDAVVLLAKHFHSRYNS